MHNTRLAFALVASVLSAVGGVRATEEPSRLVIHVDQPGIRISPTLYGLMTEEINYSYQGGLYGELIQNRDFKEDSGPTTKHWSLRNVPGAAATMTLDASQPVNTTALTTSLRLDITAANDNQKVRLTNDGYWGIPVQPETTYRASFYARSAQGFPGPLTASIESEDGATVFAQAEVPAIDTEWKPYTVALTTGKVAPTRNARFRDGLAEPRLALSPDLPRPPQRQPDRPDGKTGRHEAVVPAFPGRELP